VEYVVTAERCLLGLIFLASAGSKARSAAAFTAFADAVRDFAVLPSSWTRGSLVPGAVVAVEALVPVLLLTRSTTAAGLAVAAAVLAGLTVAVTLVVRRGAEVSCRCFGAGARLGRRHVLRNLVLAVVAGAGVLAALPAAQPMHPVGVAAAVAAGAIGAGVVVFMDDIVELFRPLPATSAG
jgi:hypothetical protein